MVSSAPLIRVIVDRLIHYQAQNLVVDPVMVSTSGSRLLEEAALEALRERLLPLAILITPNIPEAEVLSGLSIQDEQGMEEAARDHRRLLRLRRVVQRGARHPGRRRCAL